MTTDFNTLFLFSLLGMAIALILAILLKLLVNEVSKINIDDL